MLYNWLILAILLIPAIYTFSYGWWAWQKRYYLGALGCWIIALAGLVLPYFALQELI